MQCVSALGRASGVERGIVISRTRKVASILAQENSNAGCLEKQSLFWMFIGALAVYCKSAYRER